MTQTITKIEEVENVKHTDKWSTYTGWRVTTTKQVIELLIEEGQSCCENYGYATTNDDVAEFIGADLLEVKRTDKALNTAKLKALDTEECDAMFLTLETSKGTLQFCVYNSHNGYYGHDALIRSSVLNEKEML